jgi:hypothetical protein
MGFRRLRTVVLCAAALSLLLWTAGEAQAVTERGTLAGEGSSNTFTIDAGSVRYVEVKFLFDMSLAVFGVRVTRPDGSVVLNDHDLWGAENNIIALTGGGSFVLTVFSFSGKGNWTALYTLDGKKTLPRDVICLWGPEATYIGGESISGSLEGSSWTGDFSIITTRSRVDLTFTYPKGSADFRVRVTAADFETVIGDYRLDENPVVPLIGKGRFNISVYSKRGSGDWSASW